MSEVLTEELAALATMSPAQLREKWRRVFREPPPPFTPDLLARAIAYRLQEKVHGGLSTAARREIERLERQYVRTGEVVTGIDLRPHFLARRNRLARGARSRDQ